MQITLIALSTAFLLAGPQPASVPRPSIGTFTVSDCLITVIDDVTVPAQEAGVLKELRTAKLNADGTPALDAEGKSQYVEVREGLEVVEDQLLGWIDDEMERKLKEVSQYKLDVSRMEAENYISVQYAEAGYEVAKAEERQAEAANRQYPGTVPPAELTRLRLAREQARLQIEQSKYDLRVADVSVLVREAEDQVADLQIARRRIVAPVDGIVQERYVNEAEWVRPGDDVLRIVRMNRVRIEGLVEESRLSHAQLKRGQPVTVRLDSGQRQSVPGRIVFVDQIMSTGSRYQVWAEVDNVRVGSGASGPEQGAWLLSPGLKAEMTIHLQ